MRAEGPAGSQPCSSARSSSFVIFRMAGGMQTTFFRIHLAERLFGDFPLVSFQFSCQLTC